MKAYLARLKAEDGYQIVGFYVANSLPQLADMIDECCDVDRVEIMKLGPGGIYWSGEVDYAVPYQDENIEDAPSLPGGATVCEWWLRHLFEEDEGQWAPCSWGLLLSTNTGTTKGAISRFSLTCLAAGMTVWSAL